MDWLTFISSLVDSLVWPAFLFGILYLLKDKLPEIVQKLPEIARYLRRLKYGKLEMEFQDSARKVAADSKEAIPEVPANVNVPTLPVEEARERLNFIAELAPRSAILEAWLQVEAAATDLIRKKGIASFRSQPGPMRLRDHLVKGDLLNAKQISVFENLRNLRNEAVHVADAAFDLETVLSYIDAALTMSSYLEGKANEL